MLMLISGCYDVAKLHNELYYNGKGNFEELKNRCILAAYEKFREL
jgi:hypothetical protein